MKYFNLSTRNFIPPKQWWGILRMVVLVPWMLEGHSCCMFGSWHNLWHGWPIYTAYQTWEMNWYNRKLSCLVLCITPVFFISDEFVTSHSQKSPARSMLFYITNYWQEFWVQFVVQFNSHSMYCTSITHCMMRNMTTKLPCIRPYFTYSILCYQTTTNTT